MAKSQGFFTDINAAAKPLLLLANDLTIVDATAAFLSAWSLHRDEIAGRSVFQVFSRAAGKSKDGDDSADNQSRLIPIQELFDHAPGFICVTRGPEHIFEIVNKPCYQIVCHRPLIGRPVREAMGESGDNELVRLLDHVYVTGQPHVGRAHKLALQPYPHAERVEAYVDFVYQ